MSFKENSPSAYEDVRYVMDLALKKPGLIFELTTSGKAVNFKQRCNKYRNLIREMAQEQLFGVPGQRAETAYDVLVIRQVNLEGESDRQGLRLCFDHHKPEGKIIDPETGEELHLPDMPGMIKES